MASQVDELMEPLKKSKDDAEARFSRAQYPQPHPCNIPFHDARNDPDHYKKLTFVQRHKCVGTYCLKREKRQDGKEYGPPYCRFGYPMNLAASYQLVFEEQPGGGVQASFISKRNDPRMNQHCKFYLMAVGGMSIRGTDLYIVKIYQE